jgi:ADP-ribose pyrophosphatase YjhB (NUDIX family)
LLFGHRKADGSWDVLLCRRAVNPGKGLWSVVGGRRESGETATEAAIREAAEEAFSFHGRDAGAALRVVEAALEKCLSGGLDAGRCRAYRLWLPFLYSYPTYLVELSPRPPASVFRPDPVECGGVEWFPARRLPASTHWLARLTVWWLGL